ncbi:hypothetical protein BDP27DRAFT_1330330 [Rhodocollybia butyracea]|uniref:Uncharacterized protein n=1 Tax=Rhodocollybia butyracea TaxID=206335 RepID=A0A9P5PR14_9AGAR|nr:hypothetical protein BDP27DRAFT_1330330 [Rhodocollybia butyracea]
MSSDILKAGVQDLLLHLYVSDFRDPLVAHHKASLIRKSSLDAACNSFLLEVCSDPSARRQLEHHPVHSLWPLRPMLLFSQKEADRCSQRRQMWQSLGLKEIQWRISSAFDMLMDWERSFTDPFLFDLLIDLEFSGALRSLHRLSARLRSASDQAGEWNRGLKLYFDQTPLDYAQDVFSRIIQQMLRLSLQDPAADSFYKFCCPHSTAACHLRENLNGVMHLIRRFSLSAKKAETFYQVLIQADIAGFLSSAGAAIEFPDGSTLQDWPSYELLLEPSVPNEWELNDTIETSGDLPAIRHLTLNFVSNPAMCQTSSMTQWKLFFRPNSTVEVVFPYFREHDSETWIEQSDRDHVYWWIN